ncbi:hypothetical protein BDC45DRAFT_569619 [Circinella umbellata]|nr:hypothetical protein BDC45DRAFT_569619 [Circinella umbellata]
MVFSIPIYRVSDVHTEKQQNARSVFPLTPSPPTTSSSSFSSSGRLIVEEECSSSLSKGSHYIDEYADQEQHYFSSERQGKQPLKQSPSSSYRYNKPRYYGSTMDHPNAAFLGVPKSSKSIGTSKSIHSISSIGSDASFKTASSTQQQKNLTKETTTHFVDDTTMPSTPPHTTVSPNDNDEGLYLLWTHQLLRERGFKPSPCRFKEENGQIVAENNNDIINDDNDDDDDDSDDTRSTDSSLTNGEDRESSLLLTSPDLVDYESKMRMYSSYNSCASSFAGPQQDYFYQRPSTSSSMRHSSFASTSAAAAAARYAESPTTTTVGDGEEDNSTSFFASFFGACFSCNNGRR